MSDVERVLAAVNAAADRLAPLLRRGVGNKDETLTYLRQARDALKTAAAHIKPAARTYAPIIAFYSKGKEKIFPTQQAAADAFGVAIGTIANRLKSGKPLRGATIDYLFE